MGVGGTCTSPEKNVYKGKHSRIKQKKIHHKCNGITEQSNKMIVILKGKWKNIKIKHPALRKIDFQNNM